jgi:hypothetical protein
LDEIQAFLAPRGDVQNVVMRRFHKEKTFKGSIFATFANSETAEKFVKDETSTTHNERNLVKKMQTDYWLVGPATCFHLATLILGEDEGNKGKARGSEANQVGKEAGAAD